MRAQTPESGWHRALCPVGAYARVYVAPGVRSSKVLVTVLYNQAFPLIRPELTDEITLIDCVCPCGSPRR